MTDRAQRSTAEERSFAAEVLKELLHRIEVGNANAFTRSDCHTFVVSHAWTEDAVIHLVYMAPPSDRIRGLIRDTRWSTIEFMPTPWPNPLDAAIYYYLLDLDENWGGTIFREPDDDPDMIEWQGDVAAEENIGIPTKLSGLPAHYRYTSPPPDPSWVRPSAPKQERRRYGNQI